MNKIIIYLSSILLFHLFSINAHATCSVQRGNNHGGVGSPGDIMSWVCRPELNLPSNIEIKSVNGSMNFEWSRDNWNYPSASLIDKPMGTYHSASGVHYIDSWDEALPRDNNKSNGDQFRLKLYDTLTNSLLSSIPLEYTITGGWFEPIVNSMTSGSESLGNTFSRVKSKLRVCMETHGYEGKGIKPLGTLSGFMLIDTPPPNKTYEQCTVFPLVPNQINLSFDLSKKDSDVNTSIITWTDDIRLNHKLYRRKDSGNWSVVYQDSNQRKSRIEQAGLAGGVYDYKLVALIGGHSITSEIKTHRVEIPPSSPKNVFISSMINSLPTEISWNSVEFPSNSTNPRYLIEYQMREIGSESYSSLEDPIVIKDPHVVNGKVLYDFPFLNGQEYEFWISACNLHCSKSGGSDGFNTKVVVPPSHSAFYVDPVEKMNSSSDIPQPLNGASENGQYALNITSLNATQIAIHELEILVEGNIQETVETTFVPISIDPALIIPVNKYLQSLIKTEDLSNSPLNPGAENLGRWYYKYDKKLDEDSYFKNFSKSVSGRYFYTVLACDRVWNINNPDANDGLVQSDHCVVSPQIEIVVDLKIQEPDVKFDENGTLTIEFPDSNPSEALEYRIYDEQNRLIGSYTSISEAELALAAQSGSLYGYSLIACNISTCSNSVQIVVPPQTPSYIQVSGSSTGEGHKVRWENSAGAKEFKLEYKVMDANGNQLYPEGNDYALIETSSDNWDFPVSEMKYGKHLYRVTAYNDAGTSASSYFAEWNVELDPTVYIRKLLYFAYEDDSVGCTVTDASDCIVVGDNVDTSPVDGLYSRNDAAFRYLDLMYKHYTVGEGGDAYSALQHFADVVDLQTSVEITDISGTVIYGDAERERAHLAEHYIRQELGGKNSNNTKVQQLLLDIYYDRAVAEISLANIWLNEARVTRFIDTDATSNSNALFTQERDLLNRASSIYENALFGIYNETDGLTLPGFATLVSGSSPVYREVFKTYAKERAQVSPRYWHNNVVSRVVHHAGDDQNGLLVNGYKDLVLMYEMMASLLDIKAEEAKLTVMSGESNASNLDIHEADLKALREKVYNLHLLLLGNVDECAQQESFHTDVAIEAYENGELLTLDENVCDADYLGDFLVVRGLFDDELDDIRASDWNGFQQSITRYRKADLKAENAISWLEGKTNYLGLPNDMVVFKHDPAIPHNSTYDNLIADIGAGNPTSLWTLVDSKFEEAKSTYDAYRANNDRVADNYDTVIEQWTNTLGNLIGYECDQTACIPVGSEGYAASEMAVKIKQIEQANKRIEIAEAEVEAVLARMQSRIDLLELYRQNNGLAIEMTLDYGQQQIDIGERITKLRIEAAEKQRRFGAMASIASGGGAVAAAVKTGSPYAAAGSALASAYANYQSAGVAINSMKSIGRLEQLSAELALEQQVQLMMVSNAKEEAALANEIESLWLDANLAKIRVEEATLQLETEVESLNYLTSRAVHAMERIQELSTNLLERYFADPIHAKRVTNAMETAEALFEDVQLQLFLAANALEYKHGLDLDNDTSGFNKSDIFRARTSEDLKVFMAAMDSFDSFASIGKVEETKITRLSLKDHILGYPLQSTFNDQGIPTESPVYQDPMVEHAISLVDSTTAFLNRMNQGYQVYLAYIGSGEVDGSPEHVAYENWKAEQPFYFNKYESTGVSIVWKLNTAKRFKNTNGIGYVFNDSVIRSDGCYRVLGSYSDKLDRVATLVHLDNKGPNLLSGLTGSLAYEGSSYMRKIQAPSLRYIEAEQDSATNPDQIIVNAHASSVLEFGEQNALATPYDVSDDLLQSNKDKLVGYRQDHMTAMEFNRFDTRNWVWDPENAELTSVPRYSFNSHSITVVDQDVNNSNIESIIGDDWIDGLKERSVFASDWTIEIPMAASSSNEYFVISILNDIELVFDYSFVGRNDFRSEECDPGS